MEASKSMAISSLKLMATNCYPGGKEGKLKKLLNNQKFDNSDEINDDNNRTENHRKVWNSYVSSVE